MNAVAPTSGRQPFFGTNVENEESHQAHHGCEEQARFGDRCRGVLGDIQFREIAATDGELRHQVNEDVRDSDAATNRCKNVLCLRGEPGYPIGEEVSRCKYQG